MNVGHMYYMTLVLATIRPIRESSHKKEAHSK